MPWAHVSTYFILSNTSHVNAHFSQNPCTTSNWSTNSSYHARFRSSESCCASLVQPYLFFLVFLAELWRKMKLRTLRLIARIVDNSNDTVTLTGSRKRGRLLKAWRLSQVTCILELCLSSSLIAEYPWIRAFKAQQRQVLILTRTGTRAD